MIRKLFSPKSLFAKTSKANILLQGIIWIAALCAMIYFFVKEFTPIYTQESINSSNYQETPLLNPGDTLAQTFRSSGDSLAGVEVALSFAEDIPDSAQVTIQVQRGEKMIIEQPLTVKQCNNLTFLYLAVNQKNCKNETFTVTAKNTSADSNAAFALMSTDKTALYLDNTENYKINGEEYNSRLLCRFTYLDGYSYYAGLSNAFCIFLVALLASCLIKRIFR